MSPGTNKTKFQKIGLIGPFNAICGVAEYQRFFAEALERAGIKPVLATSRFCSGYEKAGLYDASATYPVFDTGHAGKDKAKFDDLVLADIFKKEGIKLAYLNYQDYLYPDKQGLYRSLSRLAASGISLYLITHDTCIPHNFPFQLFRGIILPCQEAKNTFLPTHMRTNIIPQGVPIFPKKERKQLRDDLVLEQELVIITTFGLGRSNNKEVLEAANKASMLLALPENNPIAVQMIFAKASDFQLANEEFGGERNVYLQGGYQEDWRLAAYLQASDAVVLNYPPLKGAYATSSALRFALGAGSLIFARQSNWFADVRDKNLFLPFEGVSSLATELVHVFQNEQSRKAVEARLARTCKSYVDKNSWDAIVQEHIKLWRQTA